MDPSGLELLAEPGRCLERDARGSPYQPCDLLAVAKSKAISTSAPVGACVALQVQCSSIRVALPFLRARAALWSERHRVACSLQRKPCSARNV